MSQAADMVAPLPLAVQGELDAFTWSREHLANELTHLRLRISGLERLLKPSDEMRNDAAAWKMLVASTPPGQLDRFVVGDVSNVEPSLLWGLDCKDPPKQQIYSVIHRRPVQQAVFRWVGETPFRSALLALSKATP